MRRIHATALAVAALAASLLPLGAASAAPAPNLARADAAKAPAGVLHDIIEVQVTNDITVTGKRIDNWMATHPHAGTPTREWASHRLQRTGPTAIDYIPVKGRGYCLVAGYWGQADDAPLWWYGTGMSIVTTTSLDGIAATDSTCGYLATTVLRNVTRASLMSDLMNAATAAESFITDHIDATTLTMANLRSEGYKPSKGNTVGIYTEPGEYGLSYCLYGTNPDAGFKPGQAVWYDAATGGIRDSYKHPTDGTCANAPVLSPRTAAKPHASVAVSGASVLRELHRSVRGVVTEADLVGFMIGDLRHNAATVRAYHEYFGVLPTEKRMAWHIQRTGHARTAYYRTSDGRFCLTEWNKYADTQTLLLAGDGIQGWSAVDRKDARTIHNACGWVFRHRAGHLHGELGPAPSAVRDSVVESIKNAATAAETYAVDHPGQKRWYTMANLHAGGYRPADGVTVRIYGAPALGYCLKGTAPGLHLKPGQAIWWDALTGGLRPGYNRPTDGACGRYTPHP